MKNHLQRSKVDRAKISKRGNAADKENIIRRRRKDKEITPERRIVSYQCVDSTVYGLK